MQKRFDTSKYVRTAYFSPDGHWNNHMVIVSQQCNRNHLGDELDAPTISWASCGGTDVDFTIKVMECLKQASVIFQLWAMDTVKHYEEVLQSWSENNHIL